nr:MAG TPA: hypothetical protein [Caudoviricetes sp.]
MTMRLRMLEHTCNYKTLIISCMLLPKIGNR